MSKILAFMSITNHNKNLIEYKIFTKPLASLSRLARSYTNKKLEAAKRKRQSQRQLRKALSLKRRSSSGLSSLGRSKEATLSKKGQVSQQLNQYLSQKDSIERLKAAAEDRLAQEKTAKEQAQQDIEYTGTEDKAKALDRLKTINGKIAALNSEIKQRNAAQERLVKLIADTTKQKSRLDSKLRQQGRSKPQLLEQLKSSTRTAERLSSAVESQTRQVAQATRNLVKITQKLRIQKAKKRKAKRKAKSRRKAKPKKSKRKAKTRSRKAPKRRTRKTAKRKAKRRVRKKSKRSKRR